MNSTARRGRPRTAPTFTRLADGWSCALITGEMGAGRTKAQALAAAKGEPIPPNRRGSYERPTRPRKPRVGGGHRQLSEDEHQARLALADRAVEKLRAQLAAKDVALAKTANKARLGAALSIAPWRLTSKRRDPAVDAALSAFVGVQ